MLGDGRLQTVPGGYLLHVRPGELDSDEFQRLHALTREARGRSDWSSAADAARRALTLWRGEPLADLPELAEAHSPYLGQLADIRIQILEELFTARLELEPADNAVPELRRLAAEHPQQEGLHRLLMLALHRSGRQAEALSTYTRIRKWLADELGVDPGPGLRELYQMVLAADRDGAVSAPTTAIVGTVGPLQPGPAHLPADLSDFTGRKRSLRDLCALLAPTGAADAGRSGHQHDEAVPALRVCTITGMGGVGKTALAVHVAHRVKSAFPDGQLYVNLRGRDAMPRTPEEVLGGFLRDLGVPDQSDLVDPEAKAARYRSLTAGRRLLIVLDNARDAAQVRPLLPGTGSCAVMVTSRYRLSGLDGASHFDLDGLATAEAHTLLERIIGPARVDAEPEAVEAVLGFCTGLPLAVRIAGARLASRPGWQVATLAERLADERRRLDELRLADVAVRSCFQVSYASLDQDAPGAAAAAFPASSGKLEDVDPARALRLLGLCGSAEIGLAAAAALLGIPVDAAEEELEVLVDACLLESPTPGRYRFHDLLRLYAVERSAREEPESEQIAAVERLARWTLATLAAADAALFPNSRRPELPPPDRDHLPLAFAARDAALFWCDQEIPTLATTAAAAAARGLHHLAWLIPAYALGYFRQSCRYPEWSSLNTTGLASARALGDTEAEARMRAAQSALLLQVGDIAEAEVQIRAALELRRAMGDAVGELAQLNNLGLVYEQQGHDELARSQYEEVLALARKLDRKPAEANALNNLGTVEDRLGNHEAALAHLEACRDLWRDLGDLDGDAVALANLGAVHLRRADFTTALACLQEALPVTRSFGNRIGEAEILTHQGQALSHLGQYAEARDRLVQAAHIWKELNDPRFDEVTVELAAIEA
jgi:tetratricopeptide (TPR) repeat protein